MQLPHHNPIWAWFHRAITPHAQPVQSCAALPGNLRRLREAAGMSVGELAEYGICYSTIRDIERGHVKNPTLSTVLKLSDALGVGVEELVKEG